jgi:hypothetical protein
VVFDQDVVADLTARQFDPTMPYPWVTTLPEWVAWLERDVFHRPVTTGFESGLAFCTHSAPPAERRGREVMRRTSVYTLSVPIEGQNTKDLLDKLVTRSEAMSVPLAGSGYDYPDKVFVRFRTGGGDHQACMIATILVGEQKAALHTGVGVNRRLVGGEEF